jgi:hypothetical protein
MPKQKKLKVTLIEPNSFGRGYSYHPENKGTIAAREIMDIPHDLLEKDCYADIEAAIWRSFEKNGAQATLDALILFALSSRIKLHRKEMGYPPSHD